MLSYSIFLKLQRNSCGCGTAWQYKEKISSYHPTQRSTLAKMKDVAGKSKSIVSALHDAVGGTLGASSASELPHNRRQVYNNWKTSSYSSNRSDIVDPIFVLVQQCKFDLTTGGRWFINFDTTPCCVLTTDSQLEIMVYFALIQELHALLG